MKKSTISTFLTLGILTVLTSASLPKVWAQQAPPAPVPPTPPAPATPSQPASPAEPAEPATPWAIAIEPQELVIGRDGKTQTIVAQAGNYADFTIGDYMAQDANEQVAALEKQIEDATVTVKRLSDKRDELAQGKGTKEQVDSINIQIAAIADQAKELRKQQDRIRRLAPLQKKVDVKFDNATVAQAAEALSKASGVPIRAEDSIPDTTRLTVEARHVRLATVLESVARQANLIIEPGEKFDAPDGSLSVILTMPPMLRVNDSVQKFSIPSSPWSSKWGGAPTNRMIFGVAGFSTPFSAFKYGTATATTTIAPGTRIEVNRTVTEALRSAQAAQRQAEAYRKLAIDRTQALNNYQKMANDRTQAMNGYRALGTMGTLNNAFTLQSSNNVIINATKDGTVTIIESGKNKGDSGKWKTVYSIKNGELSKTSRQFIKD